MTAGYAPNNVRHWTLEEIQEALNEVAVKIESHGKSVKELRYRASEWALSAEELDLLTEYERLERMVNFAKGESA